MKIRTFLLLLTLAVVVLFAALNWSTFVTPTALSLGVTEVQAPFGLVMLGLMAFMAVLFLVFIVYLQSGVLLEARRNATIKRHASCGQSYNCAYEFAHHR